MFPGNNPFLSFYDPYRPQQHYVDPDRVRAVAAQRAKRAQWLPDEDMDEDPDYIQLGPQERAWVNAHQAAMEGERQRRLQEGLRRRAEEEQRWEHQLDRQHKQHQETRRRLEERNREIEAKRERDRSQSPSHLRGAQPRTTLNAYNIPSQSQQKPPSTHGEQASLKSPPHRSTPSPPPAPAPQYDQKHVDAASKIQHHFRIHQSLRAIHSLSSQFHTLREKFTHPSVLSFQSPSSPPNSSDVINVPVVPPTEPESDSADVDMNDDASVPKLAFNSANYYLHSYLDSLDKLLIKLDGIESWGDQDVRTKRRAVIKQIEDEQARLEKMVKDSWITYSRTEPNA